MTRHPSPRDPAVGQPRFELADHAVVVRRSAAELQVGLDPRRALVVADGFRPVLDRLAAPASSTDLMATGRAAGLPSAEVTRALRHLGAAGLLRPATGSTPPAGARVRLVGAGPVGLPLAGYLAEGGVAELAVFDARPPDPDLYPTAGAFADQGAAAAATLAAAPARTVALDHWSKPETRTVDLTVIVSEGPEVDRVVTDHLLRQDQPHLLVRSLGDAVWIGPLVLPGQTPCVRCTDLVRTDADPGWPVVLAQLGRLRLPLPALLRDWAASTAAAQALAFLAGGRPETTGATLELTSADLRTELRTWPSHAECGCRWAASTQ